MIKSQVQKLKRTELSAFQLHIKKSLTISQIDDLKAKIGATAFTRMYNSPSNAGVEAITNLMISLGTDVEDVDYILATYQLGYESLTRKDIDTIKNNLLKQ